MVYDKFQSQIRRVRNCRNNLPFYKLKSISRQNTRHVVARIQIEIIQKCPVYYAKNGTKSIFPLSIPRNKSSGLHIGWLHCVWNILFCGWAASSGFGGSSCGVLYELFPVFLEHGLHMEPTTGNVPDNPYRLLMAQNCWQSWKSWITFQWTCHLH